MNYLHNHGVLLKYLRGTEDQDSQISSPIHAESFKQFLEEHSASSYSSPQDYNTTTFGKIKSDRFCMRSCNVHCTANA